MALCAPLMGNLTDKHGQSAVLLPVVLLHAAAVSALVALALLGAPVLALAAAAIPAGRLGAAGRADGPGPLGRQAGGLAAAADRRRVRVRHRRVHLRRRPGPRDRAVHRPAPLGRAHHRSHALAARRPALRRPARDPAQGARADLHRRQARLGPVLPGSARPDRRLPRDRRRLRRHAGLDGRLLQRDGQPGCERPAVRRLRRGQHARRHRLRRHRLEDRPAPCGCCSATSG